MRAIVSVTYYSNIVVSARTTIDVEDATTYTRIVRGYARQRVHATTNAYHNIAFHELTPGVRPLAPIPHDRITISEIDAISVD